MHITASWEGAEEVVEVDEGCRSVAALLETVAAALPELDAEKVCLEVGGCAADDEAVCGLCEGCVVTVSVLPAVRAAATLREEGWVVDFDTFCHAAEKSDLRVRRLYIDAQVAFEPARVTPLHIACDNADVELYKLLIDGGHPLDIRDISGDTLLHCVASSKSAELCKLLIDAGCATNVQNGDGFTPLHIAVLAESVELCKLLIYGGCPLDLTETTGGNTALHLAVDRNVELCEVLIDAGCATNVKNKYELTPLDIAPHVKRLASARA